MEQNQKIFTLLHKKFNNIDFLFIQLLYINVTFAMVQKYGTALMLVWYC